MSEWTGAMQYFLYALGLSLFICAGFCHTVLPVFLRWPISIICLIAALWALSGAIERTEISHEHRIGRNMNIALDEI